MSAHHTVGIVVAVLALSALGCAPAPPHVSPTLPSDRVAAVEGGLLPTIVLEDEDVRRAPLEDRMRHYGVPGVSIAVIDGGRIAWARGYGVAERGTARRITPGTLFQAASMSKPVAAVAAMRLVEEKKLGLDADVNDSLRSWKVPDNEWVRQAPVTLRRLLSHRAGLTVHGFPGYAPGEPLPTLPQILDGTPPSNTPAVRVATVPGSAQQYSGGGFTVAQLLMTDVAGEPFPELMERLVLEPLHMTESTFRQPLPAALHERAATGHRWGGAPIEGRFHVYPEMAAAGLWTTPSDLARFAIGMQHALEEKPHAILPRRLAAEMLLPAAPGQGLGFGIQGDDEGLWFGHGGSNAGFRGQFGLFPARGEGAVVMVNADAGHPLIGEILRSVAAEYAWGVAAFAPETVRAAEVGREERDALVGTYVFEPDEAVRLEVRAGEGDGLTVSGFGSGREPLIPLGDGNERAWVRRGDGLRFRVVTDETGAVVALEAPGLRFRRDRAR